MWRCFQAVGFEICAGRSGTAAGFWGLPQLFASSRGPTATSRWRPVRSLLVVVCGWSVWCDPAFRDHGVEVELMRPLPGLES